MKTIELMNQIKPEIDRIISVFPYSNSHISTLGGENDASLLFVVGLDKQESWAHGIFENSRYLRFHIERSPKGISVECFTISYKIKTVKFRKYQSTPEKVIQKLNDFFKTELIPLI